MQIAKIGAINNVKQNFLNSSKKNVSYAQNPQDTFEKSKPVSFGANMKDVIKYSIDWGYENFALTPETEFDVHYPKQKKLNILKGDDDHLRDVAESLCMYPDEDISNFSKIYYPFHFDVNRAKSNLSYAKIMPYVEEQRTKLVNLLEIKENLEIKKEEKGISRDEENGLRYIREEIERIDKKCQQACNEYLTTEHIKIDDDDDSWQID